MTSLSQVKAEFYALRGSIVRQDEQHIFFNKDETRIYGSDKDKIYVPNPTGELFHADDTFVRLIMGPYGSGKSTICINEIVKLACAMPRWSDNRRRSKCLIIRNTSGELHSTTLQTWLQWFGDLGDISHRQKPLLTYEHTFNDGHGLVELQLVFIALDRDEDIRKLKSIEATFAYINELSEVPQAVLHHLIGRVNHRYPSRTFCAEPYWSGIICDTNAPDEDHWIYKDFELNPTPSYKVFHQPSGLIINKDSTFAKDTDGNYIANTLCDNYSNLSPDYYVKLAEKRSEGFIKVYCAGKYGIVESGKRVYPEYNDDIHSVPRLEALQGLPIHLGWDFGLTPACIVFQLSPRGQIRILKEYIAEDMGIRTFAKNIVLPSLPVDFVYNKVGESEGDPAGMAGDAIMEELSCIGELNALGIKTNAASTNDIDVRISSVRYFLNMMIDGSPALLLDRDKCPVLRKGFINGYHFKRMVVSGDERFQEKPNKNKYSHCFAGETLVETLYGKKRIDSIELNDLVLTPNGYRKVTATMSSFSNQLIKISLSNSKHVVCTIDHPFILKNGIVRADELQYGDVLQTPVNNKWVEKAFIQLKNSMGLNIIRKVKDIIRQIIICLGKPNICTEMCGNSSMDLSQKDTVSITSTMTKATMTYPTFLSLVHQNMQPYMEKKEKELKKQKNIWLSLGQKPLSGINLKKALNGTQNMEKIPGLAERKKNIIVFSAIKSFIGLKEQIRKGFACLSAKLNTGVTQGLMIGKEDVSFAKKFLSVIGMKKQKRVLRIVNISHLDKPSMVYDLTIEDAHCFYANGVLVSNCHDAIQYGLMKFASNRALEVDKPKVDMWNPVFRWS